MPLIGEITVKIQRYQFKKCGKNFQVDLKGLVNKNCNVSIEIEEKIVRYFDIFDGSLHKIKEALKEEFKVDISHQKIENVILSQNIENNESHIDESGYYVFDVQYIKINGIWNYRFTLFDAKFNIPVFEEIHSNQTYMDNLKFLSSNLKYRYVKSVTTDGHPHYKKILSGLNLNHQLCIFHTKQEVNRKVSKFIKENELSPIEKHKIKSEKQQIINIFNSKNFKEARNKLNNLVKRKDNLHPFIKSNILLKIRDYFKNYTLYFKNMNIARTSNQIENYFLKTMSRSIKKRWRSIQGVKSRIAIKAA